MPRPPENPADLQPGECSPGDPDCKPKPEPECPEPPIVNVGGPRVEVNIPDPKDQPKFNFKILDPNPDAGVVPRWDSEGGCDQAAGLLDSWRQTVFGVQGPLQDVADFAAVGFGGWISNRLGINQFQGRAAASLAFSLFSEAADDSQEAFTVRAQAAAFSSVRLLYRAVADRLGESCAVAMAPATMAAALQTGMAEEGISFDYFLEPWLQESRYLCPVYLPTQPEIDAIWLGDRITSEQHECYTRALGNLPGLHRINAEEKRERPNAGQWIQLFMRGEIDQDRLFREMRKLGWLDQSEMARLVQLSAAVPAFGDVIRFMVRDTENPQAVASGQLDSGFSESFVGQLKQWATANGVTDDLARRYWRAHWQWPSNTQLYEMLHRLRPGEVPDNLAVTQEDARKVLQINDVAPAFVDKLIAVSYSPLTRVDVRRAYEIGVLTAEDVKRAYLDLGYDEKNATTLTAFTVRDVERKEARAVKVWSLAAIASAYEAGTIDVSFAFAKARLLLPSDAATEQFLFDVDAKRKANVRKKCLAAARKRFMTGEFNYLQAQGIVDNIIGDYQRAVDIVNGWDCERSGRRKEVAAGTLCKWLGQGLIDVPTLVNRLGNLGYTSEDATRMMASCGQDIFERERKAAIAEARRQKSELDKRLRELRDAIAAREKKLKELMTKEEECAALIGGR
jgi:hypothetical protein